MKPGRSFPMQSLRDQAGRPAAAPRGQRLYGFFKTTCPTCEMAWPYLDRVRKLADGGDLSIWSVSQDDPEATRDFSRRLGIEIATLYDRTPWPASESIGITTVPTFLLVGEDDTIRDVSEGFQRHKMEEFANLAARLAGRPHPELFGAHEQVPAIKPG
jgi:peroxiredoxin